METVCTLVFILYMVVTQRLALGANCFEKVADVVFILDSSVSIRNQEFKEQIIFVQNVVKNFEIGPNNIQIGMVTYSDEINFKFDLNTYQDKDHLLEAIGKARCNPGGTSTGEAIRYVRKNMFQNINGGRAWASKIIVLITDGISTNNKQFQAAQQQASFAKFDNISIFAIGVGNSLHDKLQYVASTPTERYIFKVDDYSALDTIQNSLTFRTCEQTKSAKDIEQNDEQLGDIHEPRQVCGGQPADVYFLLDSSNSIWEPHFRRQLDFVNDVIDIFDISKEKTRVGVVSFSDDVHPVIPLGSTFEKDELKKRVSKLTHLTGITSTAKAIRYVRETAFLPDVARPNVAHIAIVVTDGQSSSPRETQMEATLAHKAGVHIFAIGVGLKIDDKELMNIASDPDESNVFKVDSYEALDSIRNLLAIKTCREMTQNDMKDSKTEDCRLNSPMDVVFAYDGYSMGLDQSRNIQATIGEIVKIMDIAGNTDFRVGVVSESLRSDPERNLDNIPDLTSFETHIQRQHHDKMKGVLRKTKHVFQSNEKSDSRKVIVLFVDKKVHSSDGIIREIIRTRSIAEVFTIAVGRSPHFQHDSYSSTPAEKYLLQIPNYLELGSIASQIVESICENKTR